MMPSVQSVTTLLTKIEADLHRVGWDDTPPIMLTMVGDVVDGATLLGAIPMPFPADLFAVEAGQVVEQVGLSMLDDKSPLGALAEDLANMQQEAGVHFAGLIFASEAWMASGPDIDRQGRRLADIPGSVEVRFVTAMDCSGRMTDVTRVRGRKPRVDVYDPRKTTGDRKVGRIVDGLRDGVLAVAKHMPPGSVDRDALMLWTGGSDPALLAPGDDVSGEIK